MLKTHSRVYIYIHGSRVSIRPSVNRTGLGLGLGLRSGLRLVLVLLIASGLG